LLSADGAGDDVNDRESRRIHEDYPVIRKDEVAQAQTE
jgi:hypothetical protein